ncbi:hypothetical protein [Arthrobacter sp. ISL-69]|uniref:hypothetical protein n=1 Tax=Arthrobacter sp. ISL-69 TaxID=2819113 RepID=UPI001BE6E0AE|nr:hypothetical protein [Arthrobacter sp. ISL-69]MBT2537237.1 hypothetical protein [Arthrobacter sp. ISL-69]
MATFNQEQASAIAYVIRTLRPGWAYPAVMKTLEGFAVADRPVADVVLAAMRAATDPKATAPTAIGFEQYWAKTATGKPDNGVRLCSECLTRKPLGAMASVQPPFICQTCSDR